MYMYMYIYKCIYMYDIYLYIYIYIYYLVTLVITSLFQQCVYVEIKISLPSRFIPSSLTLFSLEYLLLF